MQKPTFETTPVSNSQNKSCLYHSQSPQGMAADMAMAVEPKAETKIDPLTIDIDKLNDITVYYDQNGKPVQKQNKVNQNFEMEWWQINTNNKTEAERISDADAAKQQREKELKGVVTEFQKRGSGSETEAKLITFNNYIAESNKRKKQIYDELIAEKPLKEQELNDAVSARLAQNQEHQKLLLN